jgi:hypothetical protein
MKLREVSEIIKGVHLVEESKRNNPKSYRELTMVSLEPISFLDERKLIEIETTNRVSQKQLTRAGDIVVSLYSPMIACYVEKGQEGYVVPHYMAIIRMKPYVKIDSRFIVQFINSTRGRRALAKRPDAFSHSRPTTLPLASLMQVDLLKESNRLIA